MFLPGRDDSEEEDFEARNALRTLFEAEEIKENDGDLLSRISKEIDRKRSILDKIALALPEMEGDDAPKSEESFIHRLRGDRIEKEFKEKESPEARRSRIEMGKAPHSLGKILVTKFS